MNTVTADYGDSCGVAPLTREVVYCPRGLGKGSFRFGSCSAWYSHGVSLVYGIFVKSHLSVVLADSSEHGCHVIHESLSTQVESWYLCAEGFTRRGWVRCASYCAHGILCRPLWLQVLYICGDSQVVEKDGRGAARLGAGGNVSWNVRSPTSVSVGQNSLEPRLSSPGFPL